MQADRTHPDFPSEVLTLPKRKKPCFLGRVFGILRSSAGPAPATASGLYFPVSGGFRYSRLVAALVFIILCTLAGAAITKRYLEPALEWPVELPRLLVLFPAAFVVGHTLGVALLYAGCLVFSDQSQPLLWGSRICCALLVIIILALRKSLRSVPRRQSPRRFLGAAILCVTLCVAGSIMWYTFTREGSVLKIGFSIWGDFGSHLGLARSFSLGSNFPAEHPQFAGDGMRYHFLFYFLAGSLEYLGLPLDWAVNLPSLLAYAGFLCLLYSLVFTLARSVLAGVLAIVLFLFRSSWTIWSWLTEHWHDQRGLAAVFLQNNEFIGTTPYENWGIWTQNVFVNQRHNAFVLSFVMLMLLILLQRSGLKSSLKKWADRRSWLPALWQPYAAIGLLLGLLGFWNGAIVLCALLLLAALAVVAEERLGLVLAGALAVLLVMLQTDIFMGGVASVKPRLAPGFLAYPVNFSGITGYYLKLLGIFPFVWIAAFFTLGRRWRSFSLVALSPALLGNIISFSSDPTMNHKFLMVSIVLGNCAVAALLARVLQDRRWWLKLAGGSALFLLTINGVVDLIALRNANAGNHRIGYDLSDPLILWAAHHTDRHAVFLTPKDTFHPLLLSGRRLFLGNQAFAASAGYDMQSRARIRDELYCASSSADFVHKLSRSPMIDYVVFSDVTKSSGPGCFNPQLLKGVLPLAFNDSAGKIAVFQAHP